MEKAKNISAIVHTGNSAQTLARALESLAFVTDITVIDMQSTDESRLIAQKYGARVVSVEPAEFVEPVRQFGIEQAVQDWILILDADEEIPEALQTKLTQLASAQTEMSGYFLPRSNSVFGKWLGHTGWWPDYQLRFFKKGTVTWPETIHSQPKIEGKTEKLPADSKLAIKHWNYTTVEDFIARLNKYTTLEVSHGTRPETGVEQFTQAALLKTFTSQFISRYFEQYGFQDGSHGMSLSLLQSLYELSVTLKRWQKLDFVEGENNDAETIVGFRDFQKELNYWLANWQIQKSSGLSKIYWRLRRKYKI